MHNLKDIRKNLEIYIKKLKDRNLDFNVHEFSKLDNLNRELIHKKELLEQEKKIYRNQKKNLILRSQKVLLKKLMKSL